MMSDVLIAVIFSVICGILFSLVLALYHYFLYKKNEGEKCRGKVGIEGDSNYPVSLDLVQIKSTSVDGSNATDEYLRIMAENKDE